MYIVNHLSSYQLDEANILDVSTGEIVQPNYNGQYLLQTDELCHLPRLGKTIKLKRRFTREQLNKMIEQSGTPVAKEVEHPQNGTEKTEQSVKVEQILEENGTGQYSVNGTVYNSLRDVSKELGTPTTTLKRWFDSGKEGYIKL